MRRKKRETCVYSLFRLCLDLTVGGQTLYKQGKHREALGKYTMAANFGLQRPPWEANQFMREELSTVISNRSAALFELGDYVGALVDAEAVISLKRPWSKGHFRAAKALLALNREEDAMNALKLGLQYEPTNAVRRIVTACST